MTGKKILLMLLISIGILAAGIAANVVIAIIVGVALLFRTAWELECWERGI